MPDDKDNAREGWLNMRSKLWQKWEKLPRWVSLTQQAVETYKDRNARSVYESFPLNRLHNSKTVAEAQFGRKYCFTLMFYEGGLFGNRTVRELAFQAGNKEECEAWVTSIAAAINKTAEAGGSFSSSKEVPVSKAKGTAGKGKGKPPGPPPPAAKGKGKGKDKGKGPPLPPDSPTKACESHGPLPPGGKPPLPTFPLPKNPLKGKGRGGLVPQLRLSKITQDDDVSFKPFDRVMPIRDKGEVAETDNPNIWNHAKTHRTVVTQEEMEELKAFEPIRQERKQPLKTKTPQRTVLSNSTAQNCAIVLRRFALRGEELVFAIRMLEPGSLDEEQMERLSIVLPKNAELRKLRDDKEPDHNMRDMERELKPICKIPRVEQRLRAMCITTTLEDKERRLHGQMVTVQDACDELLKSPLLHDILSEVWVMYNFINHGKTRLQEQVTRGFDIASLVTLKEFKAKKGRFNSYNGLHYIVDRLLEKKKVTDKSLKDEVPNLAAAARMEITAIVSGVAALQADLVFLRAEHSAHSKSYGNLDSDQVERIASPRLERGMSQPLHQSPAGSEDSGSDKESDQNTKEQHPTVEVDLQRKVQSRRVGFWSKVFNYVQTNFRSNVLGLEGNLQTAPVHPVQAPQGAPPPTKLLMCNVDGCSEIGEHSSESWNLVTVDVRAPGLLCYSDGSETFYKILAGAKVVPFGSHEASELGKQQRATRPWGFELCSPSDSGGGNGEMPRLWWDAPDAHMARRWLHVMQALAAAPGAGYLHLLRPTGIWRMRWVVLHMIPTGPEGNKTFERVLMWYRTPGEYLRERPCIGGICLTEGTEAHKLTDKSCTRGGKSAASSAPFGFEVSVPHSAAGDSTPSVVGSNVASNTSGGNRMASNTSEGTSINSNMSLTSTAAKKRTTIFSAQTEAEMKRWVELLESGSPPTPVDELVKSMKKNTDEQVSQTFFQMYSLVGASKSGEDEKEKSSSSLALVSDSLCSIEDFFAQAEDLEKERKKKESKAKNSLVPPSPRIQFTPRMFTPRASTFTPRASTVTPRTTLTPRNTPRVTKSLTEERSRAASAISEDTADTKLPLNRLQEIMEEVDVATCRLDEFLHETIEKRCLVLLGFYCVWTPNNNSEKENFMEICKQVKSFFQIIQEFSGLLARAITEVQMNSKGTLTARRKEKAKTFEEYGFSASARGEAQTSRDTPEMKEAFKAATIIVDRLVERCCRRIQTKQVIHRKLSFARGMAATIPENTS